MKTINDASLREDVMDEIEWRTSLKLAEIGVSVKDGVVTLSGSVDSYSKKRSAELAAEKVVGVKAIVDDIEVKLPGTSIRDDEAIARAAYDALLWHASLPDEKIKIIVDDGWIKLEGEVEWSFQKRKAEESMENLTGVYGVVNAIKVKPQVSVEDINRRIQSALARQASLDAKNIHVDVDGSKVILTGKVRSYVEKKDAENAVWIAPGVTAIDDQLEISYT
ncbi:MAG: BON domain-containing protein [Bacteroidota bacterium]